jgi:hypothetical protein
MLHDGPGLHTLSSPRLLLVNRWCGWLVRHVGWAADDNTPHVVQGCCVRQRVIPESTLYGLPFHFCADIVDSGLAGFGIGVGVVLCIFVR